jgi:Arc/MetJ family transcription regulator
MLMRTNILLDDDLVEEAMEVSGAHTKKDVVHLALQELVKSRKKKNLADLAGRIRFRDGFDHKAMRKLRG